MTLPGRIVQAVSGMRGLDCDQHLSQEQALAFRNHENQYRFVLRYVPRVHPQPGDISFSEASGILAGGLALMLVQHVQKPGWTPTGLMGRDYGAFAAYSAQQAGYQMGGMLWCDLEGVRRGVDPRDVVAFCNNWHDKVGTAGYTPGLYVGFDAGLTADQLYKSLRFEHYWSAYNLNRDQFPAVRGVQMKQTEQEELFGVTFDPNEIQADKLGGLPLMLADNEWTP